jgi:ribulose-5-phosphate 4-epimerase/fuculose-1-phosphate aldolase
MSPRRPKLPGSAIDRLGATYQYLLGKKKDPTQQGVEGVLNRDVRDALISDELRQEMIRILLATSQLGLTTGRISEASHQFFENQFLVTRKNCWFQDLKDDDLILILAAVENVLSTEENPRYWDWQLAVYKQNPETKAIIIAQPAAVMALASEGRMPREDVLPIGTELIGKISLCEADGSSLSQKAQGSRMMIIPGVGVLSQGKSLIESAANLELLERLSEITLLAK